MVAIVCERMSWTLDDYYNQPEWFIQTLLIKWSEDSRYNESKQST